MDYKGILHIVEFVKFQNFQLTYLFHSAQKNKVFH